LVLKVTRRLAARPKLQRHRRHLPPARPTAHVPPPPTPATPTCAAADASW
jgi:hypothetical protein